MVRLPVVAAVVWLLMCSSGWAQRTPPPSRPAPSGSVLSPAPPAAAELPKPLAVRHVHPSRTLNGHAFIPLLVVPWPFVAWQLSSRSALGISELKVVPVIRIGGGAGLRIETVRPKSQAQLAAISQTFDFAFVLTRWLGLDLALTTLHAVGVNNSGAFNFGVNYAFGGQLGFVARLVERRNWLLSTRVEGSTLKLGAVIPARLTQSISVIGGSARFNPATVIVDGSRVAGAFALAFAANPSGALGLERKSVFGVQSGVGVNIYRDTLAGVSVRVEEFTAGLGTSARFNELGVPMTLLVGGGVTTRLGTDGPRILSEGLAPPGTTRGTLECALYYAKPDDIDAGLSVTFQFAEGDRRTLVRAIINRFW